MDNKKFKKEIKIFVPVSDKDNILIVQPGSNGFIILSDTTGTFKVAVKKEDLKEAMDEADIMHSLYYKVEETKEEEPITDFTNLNDVGYED